MIVLFRHGRTFEDGEESYHLGPDDDPPLTREGFRQAEKAAKWAKGLHGNWKVFCGPQRRHRHFAESFSPIYFIVNHLNEGGSIGPLAPNTIYITSNGPLKAFHDCVKCGNYCILDDNGKILEWNKEP